MMTSLEKKEFLLELIQDTVSYYSSEENRFSRLSGKKECRYITQHKDGRETYCGVGRLFSDEMKDLMREHIDDFCVNRSSIEELLDYELVKKRIHKENYWIDNRIGELSVDFLKDLQELHDRECYWEHRLDEQGIMMYTLSEEGKLFVEKLKNYLHN